ncbi:MAG TPA: TolC family protein [Opitutaceae bacterium]|nr:TolC family protein [Opitutaceae bacterium]
MNKTFFLSLSCLSLPALCAAEEPLHLTPEFVNQLVAEAQKNNLGLKVFQARTDAAVAATESVRTWEDPTVSFGFSRPTSRGFKSSEEGNLIYGIDEKLPVFGRPELARHVAEADAAKEKLNTAYETERLRRDLTQSVADLALSDEIVRLTFQDLGWLETILSTVDNRYRVGKASQVEWLKIQTERAKVADRLQTLKLEQAHKQVQLNRLLNRDLHSNWPEVVLSSVQPAVVDEDALTDSALRTEPKLRVMHQEVAQADAMAQLTHRRRLPEIGVGLQARQYSGDWGIREGMATVSFSLPWVNAKHYDSDYRRDKARVHAAEHEAADYELTLREGIHHLTIDIDAARRQAVLYRDELIPLAEQTVSSASAAWENNLGVFQDVLDARRLLIEDRLMLAQSLADHIRKLADLALLTGANDFTALFQQSNDPTKNRSTASTPGESK